MKIQVIEVYSTAGVVVGSSRSNYSSGGNGNDGGRVEAIVVVMIKREEV